MDGQTDGRTFAILESLSRLKKSTMDHHKVTYFPFCQARVLVPVLEFFQIVKFGSLSFSLSDSQISQA